MAGKKVRDSKRKRIDRDFVRSGAQQAGHIIEIADAAANRQRHKTLFRRARHNVKQQAASRLPIRAKRQQSMSRNSSSSTRLRVVNARIGNRSAHVTQIREARSFHGTPAFQQQFWNDACF